MITLEYFNKRELLSFLNSERFKTMPRIPIGEMRGHAQTLNPNASDDDVLLIVAFENEQMVGYLGILPTTRNFPTDNLPNCGWYSCLWVDMNQRGKGVSKTMLTKGFELWKNQILLTEFVPAIKGMYEALGVFESHTIPGIRLYIRGDFGTILPPKHKVFMRSKTLIKTFDRVINTVFDLRFKFKKALLPYTFEETKSIDDELANFISETSQNELFPRNTESLLWMLNNPWVRSGNSKTEMEEKYYFTSVTKRFEFKPIIVRDNTGVIVAYFIFALRDDHIRIPYLYSHLESKALVDIVYHFINEWRLGTLTTYQEKLVKPLQEKRFPVYYAKGISREFLIHKDMMAKIDWSKTSTIQDGAGDCAFT
jgi:hypothetical protein